MKSLRKIVNKKLKIENKGKSYSKEDSILYNIKSKKKLSSILYTSIENIKSFDGTSKDYRIFQHTIGDKARKIEAPKKRLDEIHTRIASLLSRIKIPDYIHSGVCGKDYISNAEQHLGNIAVLSTDIKSFYQSCTSNKVYDFFKYTMSCSDDVSWLLSKICTCNNHLPTGSRLSMVMSYWVNHKMYNDLYKYCRERCFNMSVYVDDITISGQGVNRLTRHDITAIIKKYNFDISDKKTKIYKYNDVKVITGVVIKGNSTKVKNKHHKSVYEMILDIKNSKDAHYKQIISKKLFGTLQAMGQIEEPFKYRAKIMRRKPL